MRPRRAPRRADLLTTTANYCEGRVAPDSIYGVLHRECFNLFPDEMFADLFTDVGRRSVPPMIVAVVMVLQRIEGLSDREAVERFSFDARWEVRRRWLGLRLSGFVQRQLRRDADYATAGKPVCDYDDPAAREALVDALARDALALLASLHGRKVGPEVSQAAGVSDGLCTR